MYADDTTLISSDTDFINLVNVRNTELKMFYDCALANLLSNNVGKIFCIVFGNRSVDIDGPNFVLGNVQIKLRSRSRFLGIILDDEFIFNHHATFLLIKYLSLLVSYISYKVTCIFPV